MLRKRSAASSAPQCVMMSSAVRRHWRREGTKMITGFVGAYSMTARYAGLDIAIMSDGKCGTVKL
jgi:hypothetical protein